MVSRTLRNIAVLIAGLLITGSPAFASLHINIPRLHLKSNVNYVSQDLGPRLYYEDRNTVAIAGHRVTPWRQQGWSHGAFYDIDKLKIDDFVYLRFHHYINVYRVNHIYLHINPNRAQYFVKFPGLVLSACTPKHYATYRYVVRAKLVNVIHA